MFGIRCNSYRDTNRVEDIPQVHDSACLNRLTQTLGSPGRIPCLRFWKKDCKFLSTITADYVLTAVVEPQRLCHQAQNRVAGLMSKRVVETLEVIDIKQDNRERAAFPFRAQ